MQKEGSSTGYNERAQGRFSANALDIGWVELVGSCSYTKIAMRIVSHGHRNVMLITSK